MTRFLPPEEEDLQCRVENLRKSIKLRLRIERTSYIVERAHMNKYQ